MKKKKRSERTQFSQPLAHWCANWLIHPENPYIKSTYIKTHTDAVPVVLMSAWIWRTRQIGLCSQPVVVIDNKVTVILSNVDVVHMLFMSHMLPADLCLYVCGHVLFHMSVKDCLPGVPTNNPSILYDSGPARLADPQPFSLHPDEHWLVQRKTHIPLAHISSNTSRFKYTASSAQLPSQQ